MSDIIGYVHPKVDASGESKVVVTLRSLDNTIRCGCRFKYIVPEIEFSYENLTKALTDAIDKEAKMTNGAFVTDERNEAPVIQDYDYDALMAEFQSIVGELMQTQAATVGPKITQVVERYFGKNKKISEATRDQAELVYLVVSDIKTEILGQ
jgi:L-lactate utilization protein LutC